MVHHKVKVVLTKLTSSGARLQIAIFCSRVSNRRLLANVNIAEDLGEFISQQLLQWNESLIIILSVSVPSVHREP